MDVCDLKNNELIKDWFLTLNPKQNTAHNYLQGMKNFTDYTGKSPEDLLKEAEEEIKSGKLMRERSIKRYLAGFRKHVIDSGYAPTTVKGFMTGVKSFYVTFDIELPSLARLDKKARPLEKHNVIPTKEDIQEVLGIADVMEKALILTGVSSGLSANEIINLEIGKFKNGYDHDTGITSMKIRREKTGVDFVAFLTPEATKAINEYLEYRGRKAKTNETRRLNQLEKQRVVDDSGYLFIQRHVPDEYIKTRDEQLRKLSRASIMKIYEGISERAQKNTKSGDWNFIRSHNMRKYFNSAMLNAGADSFFVEYCMGHALDDTRAAYFRASPDKLKEIYKKYVPYLTIQKDLDVSVSPEYITAVKRAEKAEAEAVRVSVERNEIQALKSEIDRLKAAESERDKLIHAFDDIRKEEKARLDEVERVTGEEYETAVWLYDVGAIMPPESEKLKEHKKRLKIDPVYREAWREATSNVRKQNFEKSQSDAKELIITRLSNVKTLADDL